MDAKRFYSKQNTVVTDIPVDSKEKVASELPRELKELDSPYQFFKYFLTEEILTDVVYQSTLYSVQKQPDKQLLLTVKQLEQFIGCCIYMSIVQLPSTRNYRNLNLNRRLVSEVMSCNQWKEIKHFLHFKNNDNFVNRNNEGHDKLFKIRPLLTKIRERLLSVPNEEYLAVDKQMIPTKAQSTLKQYNPEKPHKWGYKTFVLSGMWLLLQL
ncbi:hypothetical protein ILUMI_19812 [Ignelater luminosus]|uniref:PiggyBac transposable element-derived protein domain-containing protein n=1 Tax=Ignelater luminosus TaxID=2038154 RepID=A0A8K0CM76_IGNLU|nr:hypothetical protein ILUMI_19812 [Ignelater luminosus]